MRHQVIKERSSLLDTLKTPVAGTTWWKISPIEGFFVFTDLPRDSEMYQWQHFRSFKRAYLHAVELRLRGSTKLFVITNQDGHEVRPIIRSSNETVSD